MRSLYGTTPPRVGTSEADVAAAADKLAARLRPLPLDAVVVYDIQDETGRTQLPRPFPFVRTIDPRAYARLLTERGVETVITYKSLGDLDEKGWTGWLDESDRTYGARLISVVGRPSSGAHYPLALSQAIRLAARHPAGFTVGGVAIAERHGGRHNEAQRLVAKASAGCGYFISQAVYDAGPTIALLHDYLRECRDVGVSPSPIVLTFAPCARERTLTFIRWLGVTVTPATERAILGAANPLAASIKICRDNLRRILDQPYRDQIPLGVNVESLSIKRDEIDASIDLFQVLRDTFDGR